MKNNEFKKDLREFGLLFGFLLPIILGFFIPFIMGHSFRFWTLWIGLFSIITSFIKPILLFYPYQFWMKLGNLLGWVNSRIILGIIFIFVLQPIALIMKLFNYDPLRKNKKNLKTYKEYIKNKNIDLNRIF